MTGAERAFGSVTRPSTAACAGPMRGKAKTASASQSGKRSLILIVFAEPSGGRMQAVADTADRVNERNAEAGVDLLAQARDEDLDRARVVFVVALPDALAELRPRKDAPRFLHEH